MESEERRYKVLKLQKYNSQIRNKETLINYETAALFVSSSIALCFITLATKKTPQEVMFYVDSFIGGSSTIVSIGLITCLVKSILIKTVLKSKADELLYELESHRFTRGGR